MAVARIGRFAITFVTESSYTPFLGLAPCGVIVFPLKQKDNTCCAEICGERIKGGFQFCGVGSEDGESGVEPGRSSPSTF